MSTLIKHRNINNSLIPKLNIPDTIHLKEAGLLYWDIAKISSDLELNPKSDDILAISQYSKPASFK